MLADRYTPPTSPSAPPQFAKLIRDFVTGPLQMNSTLLEPTPPAPVLVAEATPNCNTNPPTPPPPPVAVPCYWSKTNAFAGGGGLVSTIEDMATFVAANLGFNRLPLLWLALNGTHQGIAYGQNCVTAPALPNCQGLAWGIDPPNAKTNTVFPILERTAVPTASIRIRS